MEILGFKEYRLLLEQEDPTAPPPPASPATDMPPTPTTPATPPDLGTSPSTLPPDPNAAPPTPEEPQDMKFIFIQDAAGKKWHGEHDKNGGAKKFTVYGVSKEDLEKWLTAHKMDAKSDKVEAALTGKREMPSSVYSEFKKEVVGGELGTDKGTIDITFDSENNFDNPSTTDLDVVFLKPAK